MDGEYVCLSALGDVLITGTTEDTTELNATKFVALLRSHQNSLDAYLGQLRPPFVLAGSQADVYCHYLLGDGNSLPRVKDLARHLACRIVDFCIPRTRILRAQEKDLTENTTRHTLALHSEARHLFTKYERSGEGGEILLYLVTEAILQVPQLLCKMPLKTSAQMPVHGADAIHGAVDAATGRLVLYWGESKLHKSIRGAVSEGLDGLSHILLSSGIMSDAVKRDIQLLSNNLDLTDPALEQALLRYLDPDDPHFRSLHYKGIFLVGFDSDSYPSLPNSVLSDDVRDALATQLSSWDDVFANHITAKQLLNSSMHIFCIPLPSVEVFRGEIREALGIA